MPHRSADHAPELIAAKARFFRREKIPSIEDRIAMEFIKRTMKVVGSRLGRDDDLAAGLPSVFGGIRARQHLEFEYGVKNRTMQRLVGGFVVVVDAVFDVVVRHLAVAGDVEATAKTERGILRRRKNIRLQLGELEVIASVKRQFDNLLLINDVADRSILGGNEG